MGYTLIHYLQLDRVSLPDFIAFALFISLSLSLLIVHRPSLSLLCFFTLLQTVSIPRITRIYLYLCLYL